MNPINDILVIVRENDISKLFIIYANKYNEINYNIIYDTLKIMHNKTYYYNEINENTFWYIQNPKNIQISNYFGVTQTISMALNEQYFSEIEINKNRLSISFDKLINIISYTIKRLSTA